MGTAGRKELAPIREQILALNEFLTLRNGSNTKASNFFVPESSDNFMTFSKQFSDHICPFNCISIYQDPVVQSIVSLTSSLRGQLVKCFTTL